jgi:S-adenosylmethionine:tRNA ribosyltransferase-isomerase
LIFKKPTGGEIEIFCLEPSAGYRDITTAMLQKGSVTWKCLVGGASKWKHGMTLQKVMVEDEQEITLSAEIADRTEDSFLIKLTWQPAELTFAEILHIAGKIPLPPYLHRSVEEADKERYQTIYARHEGSVAAPTAGLHFTSYIFSELR